MKFTVEESFSDQPRDTDGKFGEGGGGGLPKNDSHVSEVGGHEFGSNDNTPHQNQIKWAHDKAKEQNRPVYVTKNHKTGPGHGPHALAYKPPTKGDYHAVHPDGRITYHPGAPAKPKKIAHVASAADMVACARAIETTADGKAPHAVRLWKAGINPTDKGDIDFTPKSAALVMAAYEKRGCPLVFDYEHETLLPLEQRGGAPMKGVASAPSSVLEIRNDASGAPECWASSIGWTAEAIRQIESGERRQISPVSDVNKKTREVTAIINVALCIEGATHGGSLLASAAKGKVSVMDELIQKICDAAAAMDWATVEALAEQAEQMEGGAGAAKMARQMAAAGKVAPPAPKPAALPVPMAASRIVVTDSVQAEAFTRGMADLARATAESKRATVEMMIATSRECFDAVDEKEHLASADPATTRKHIASVKRKVETGTIAASRAAVAETGARPPGGKSPADETHGLDATEIMAAARQNVSLEDFAAAKKRHAGAGKGN